MAQELILMTDVNGLGTEGSKVKVSEGYARNFLIPRGLAVPVTNAALRRLEKNRQERETRVKLEMDTAQALAKTIEQASCTIAVKVGENEKLFGSVTHSDIAESLKAQDIQVDKHHIILDEPIRQLGVYNVKIRLHPNVDATLKVWVVGE